MNSRNQKQSLESVRSLFAQVHRHLRVKHDHYDRNLCDGTTIDIVWLAMCEFKKTGNRRWVMSSYHLAKLCHSTRARIRKRLEVLAQFSLIKVTSKWRNDGSNKRRPTEIILSDLLIRCLEVGCDKGLKMKAIEHFCRTGLKRMDYDEPVQGFKDDVAFGAQELSPGDPIQGDGEVHETVITDEDINELVAKSDDEKRLKFEERELWRKRDAAFVQAAANVWVSCMQMAGYGAARPNWEGETPTLSPGARKERLELVKIFQQYGCKISGLAWFLYVKGEAALDPKTGRPIFDISSPHRQFVSIDKKPSSFAKHFNALLRDQSFRHWTMAKHWGQTCTTMAGWYGDLWDVGPRDGNTEAQKLGYELGTDTATIHEVNA